MRERGQNGPNCQRGHPRGATGRLGASAGFCRAWRPCDVGNCPALCGHPCADPVEGDATSGLWRMVGRAAYRSGAGPLDRGRSRRGDGRTGGARLASGASCPWGDAGRKQPRTRPRRGRGRGNPDRARAFGAGARRLARVGTCGDGRTAFGAFGNRHRHDRGLSGVTRGRQPR